MYICSSRLGVKEELPFGIFGTEYGYKTDKKKQYGFEGRLNHHRVQFLRGKMLSVLFQQFANKLHTTDLKMIAYKVGPGSS